MELDVTTLDMLPAATESNLWPCEQTCRFDTCDYNYTDV
ncbi:ALQxL family class IV lanthipeptide [Streptosporangium sp. NPDC049644]